MKYPYIVIKDGMWYPAGADVPGDASIEKEEVCSKSDINRMPVAELRALAKKESIKDYGEKTGAELKKLLIHKYGL